MSDIEEAGDDYINNVDCADSDSDHCGEVSTVTCAECSIQFPSNAKGSDVVNELCPDCAKKMKDDMLNAFDEMDSDEEKERSSSMANAEEVSIAQPPAAVAVDDIQRSQASSVLEYVPLFVASDATLTVEIGGYSQCLCNKKFRMDADHPVVKCYIDPEINAVVPICFNYYVLSALFNTNIKRVSLSFVKVRRSSDGEFFIVLGYLRTKCAKPRYDIVLVKDAGTPPILLSGISRMNNYSFHVDESIGDREVLKQVFVEFLRSRYMWDPNTSPNKDETGNFITDGFDPVAAGVQAAAAPYGLQGKRKRKPRKCFDPIAPKTGDKRKRNTKLKKSVGKKQVSRQFSHITLFCMCLNFS